MKKAVIIILSVLLFLIVALAAIPFFFKDKIIARVNQEIASSVNADVFYDIDKISLSVFKRFPNVSTTIREFGIKGHEPFENDTLMYVNSLQVDLNLRSILFGDQPELTGLHLNGGEIFIKVLEDGQANYDIAIPSDEPEASEVSSFNLGINLIEVNDLNFVYDDRQLQFFLGLTDVSMVGSGDFSADVYDLAADAKANLVRMDYEGVNYLSNKLFTADTKINVDLENMQFTFGDGSFGLNDFFFEMDGFISMPDEDIVFDLDFHGRDNTFKSLLSLIPGMYTDNFRDIRTDGNMDFSGFVKGVYTENTLPAFQVALQVNDGMFQYPDLPRPVSDINLDLLVKNESGNIDDTQVNIPTFNLNFGSNPISGRLLLENLRTYDMDGQLIGKLNLEELTSIFPIQGTELRGLLDVNASAKGRYDSVANIIPRVDAKLALTNGYVKSSEYPAPIEKMNVRANILNTTGNMNDLVVNLSDFGFELEGEKIEGFLKVADLKALNWDGAVKGSLDLGKMAKIMKMDEVIMEGAILADLTSKGSYADVEAKRYQRLDTKGMVSINDFYYADNDLPQGIRIRKATGNFNPQNVSLTEFDARFGKSPVTATGAISNYMPYLFEDKEVLRGNLNIESSSFDVNEWLVDSGAPAENQPLQVIELPRNIDFTMTAKADEVLYDKLVLKNTRGTLLLKDGVLTFRDAAMSAMGGTVTLEGNYNTQDITTPTFDFKLGLTALSIQEAFKSLNTVQAFAPIAQHVNGQFTTNFSLAGILGQDMMPVLSSLDGKGLVKVLDAALKDSPIIKGITSMTRLEDSQTLNFKDLNLNVEIQNGMLNVKPFDVRLWDYQANIQGSTGFDGRINYLVNMQVPAGRFGSQANAILSTLSGDGARASTVIPVSLNLGGTYQNPTIGLAGGNSIEALLTNALRSRLSSEQQQLQQQVTDEFRAKEDSLKQELTRKSQVAQDSVKKEAEKLVEQTKDKAADEVKNILKGVLGRPKPTKPDTSSKEN
ncbi:AsmA-like C-terminal region-containing protein [Pararhodonellum marinum]|uniref:AsmA-like C-terminal region-containing protein n=1 Tax=Pararhodonellum marinum TaxID=2755358 RepID=UPI00188F8F6B|nr:AsmA-like C-terminal region-containing protein [Pararhodonellum marinum]